MQEMMPVNELFKLVLAVLRKISNDDSGSKKPRAIDQAEYKMRLEILARFKGFELTPGDKHSAAVTELDCETDVAELAEYFFQSMASYIRNTECECRLSTEVFLVPQISVAQLRSAQFKEDFTKCLLEAEKCRDCGRVSVLQQYTGKYFVIL